MATYFQVSASCHRTDEKTCNNVSTACRVNAHTGMARINILEVFAITFLPAALTWNKLARFQYRKAGSNWNPHWCQGWPWKVSKVAPSLPSQKHSLFLQIMSPCDCKLNRVQVTTRVTNVRGSRLVAKINNALATHIVVAGVGKRLAKMKETATVYVG